MTQHWGEWRLPVTRWTAQRLQIQGQLSKPELGDCKGILRPVEDFWPEARRVAKQSTVVSFGRCHRAFSTDPLRL